MLSTDDMQEFWYVRLGDDAFFCRTGTFLIAFELFSDASIFRNSSSWSHRTFAQLRPATLEDFEYEASSAKTAVFTSTAFDGQVRIVLEGNTQSMCTDEKEALRYIANAMCLGWGADGIRFIAQADGTYQE